MKLISLFILIIVLSACGGGSEKSDFAVSGTGDATYRITLNASWSSSTHPLNFPGNPHFSSLVGATHNSSAVYWQEGGFASQGIEQMAETGGTSSLTNEINNNIALGNSEFMILGDGIGASPGSRSFTLPVNASHAYLTLVSMLAPSPDWFIGVNGYNLMPAGNWVSSDTITLYAYDAGTDNGITYTSGNSDTDPPELIHKIVLPPFLVNTNVVPVGELVIEKIN